MKYAVAVLFLSTLLVAQVQPPQVPMTGRIGPGGNFPLLNSGTIVMPSDADYTMAYPDTSALVLRITSAVPLTSMRRIIAPRTVGFQFTVQNATTGGQSIQFVAAGGTGVTILNGQTMLVVCDGTNYVSAGAGGDGGGGEVMAKDLKQWGVKSDGRVAGEGCVGTQGSTSIGCWDFAYDHQIYTQADVGKLAILYGGGPPTGMVYQDGTYQVVSGGSGGTDGFQPITFTDPTDGCSLDANGQPNYATMPYYWVTVVNGSATGQLYSNPAFHGDHCIHPPTQGTVATVNGTVTFSGGMIGHGDLPTKITAVTGITTVEIADPVISTVNGAFVFGSDDHDAFEAACNDHTAGHLTFTGITLTSHGITCNNPTLWLEGAGYYPMQRYPQGTPFPGAIIVYAGKGDAPHSGAARDWVLEMANGVGAKMWRFSVKGNTMARPYGLMPSFGRPETRGQGNGAMYDYSQLWLGWEWGDQENSQGYTLESCIFSNAVPGNGDFHTLDQIYCYSAETGLDGVNNQAVAWKIGKWQSENDNIGIACFGSPSFSDYYTEYNRLDIMIGSPNYPGGYCPYIGMTSYGGESSANELTYSPLGNGNGAQIDINPSGFGLAQPLGVTNPSPNKIMVDFSWAGYARWTGGTVPGHFIAANHSCGGNAQYGYEIDAPPDQILWNSYDVAACAGLQGVPYKNTYTNTDMVMDWLYPDTVGTLWGDGSEKLYPVMRHDFFNVDTTGSTVVYSPTPPGQAGSDRYGFQWAPFYMYPMNGDYRYAAQPIDANQTTIPLNSTGTSAVAGWVSTTIRIGNEFMGVTCTDDPSAPNYCYSQDTWNPFVNRGFNSTVATSHNAGDMVTVVGMDERGTGTHGTLIGFLRSGISATDQVIPMSWVPNGAEIRIDDEYMTVTNSNQTWAQAPDGSWYAAIQVTRGARGSQQASHVAGQTVNRVAGNVTYHYEVTCSDPQNRETPDAYNKSTEWGPIGPITNTLNDRPGTLNDAEYNVILFWPHRGCAYYNLYGDQGSGPLGFLKTIDAASMGHTVLANFPNVAFFDFGKWTKNTSRQPPTATQSGVVEAEGGFIAGRQPGLSTTLTIGTCTLTITGGLITGHSGTGCP